MSTPPPVPAVSTRELRGLLVREICLMRWLEARAAVTEDALMARLPVRTWLARNVAVTAIGAALRGALAALVVEGMLVRGGDRYWLAEGRP